MASTNYFVDLDQVTIDKLSDASASGRSKSILDDMEMDEVLGAIYAAINDLDSRVTALEP